MNSLNKTFAIFCYLLGLATILYYVDFFTGFYVPKWINSETTTPIHKAVIIDSLLIALFALQHTIMARTGFKIWFKSKFSDSISRAVYILLSSIALGALIFFWQPIDIILIDLRGTVMGSIIMALYYLGWVIGILSTFEIDHFELFGLRQAFYPERNEYQQLKTPFFYSIVRHPIYLGWILIHWMTPVLTVGHVLLASGITIYIRIALVFEERDLLKEFGNAYRDYMKSTPGINPILSPFMRNSTLKWIFRFASTIILIGLMGYSYITMAN